MDWGLVFSVGIMLLRSLLLLFLLWNANGVKSDNDAYPSSKETECEVKCSFSDLNESCVHLFSDDEDILNCSLSNNSIILISTDIVLSSKVTIQGVNSIAIIGQNNSNVSCNDIGSVKFVSCNNVTIKGVNWERCGSVYNPGLQFYNTSNIAIQNCSFHHSTGKAVTLSKVSGNVSINNCQFTHNKYHKGHGAAIYYASSHEESSQVAIRYCDFTFNGPAESIVYINNSNNEGRCLLENSKFVQNQGVPIYISHTSLIFNNIVSFKSNKATAGGAIYSSNSIIRFDNKCNVSFYNNSADGDANGNGGGGGAIFQTHSKLFFSKKAAVIFTRNSANCPYWICSTVVSGGGAIYSEKHSLINFEDQSMVTFNKNKAVTDGGAMNILHDSNIIFCGRSIVSFFRNKARIGGAIGTNSLYSYASRHPLMSSGENSKVRFNENSAFGEAVYTASITFHESSRVTYTSNIAEYHGGAIFAQSIKVLGSSIVKFIKNHAAGGGAIRIMSILFFWLPHPYTISFADKSIVIFSCNSVTNEGGAIMIGDRGKKSFSSNFSGYSKVTFFNNTAQQGGAFYSRGSYFELKFQEKANVTFVDNQATQGGAAYFSTNSHVTFMGNSLVNFSNNTASMSGGAISLPDRSDIQFTGHSTTYFNKNLARQHGGAISSDTNTRISYNETCSVMFTSNTAMQQGGAVYLFDKGMITFGDNCNVSYNNNTALAKGGAIYFALQSTVTFHKDSVIRFESNKALFSGGALYSFINRPILFEGNSKTAFYHNMVRQDGGAIQSFNTTLRFGGNSSVNFSSNTAMQQGGALNLFYNSAVMFQEDSTVTLTRNTAMQHGGAIYVHDYSSISFIDRTIVVFYHNMAENDGGALYSYDHCNITIGQYSEVMFVYNSAMQCGGAMCCNRHSDVTLEGPVTFTNNTAEHGGAVCVSQSVMKLENTSELMLNSNRAVGNGGGLHFDNQFRATFDHGSSISFSGNRANQYGGALYCEVRSNIQDLIALDPTGINFNKNVALIGDSVYIDIQASCKAACINNTIVGITKETIQHTPMAEHIHTPPSKLVLHNPAVCINDDNVTDCGKYYVSNIMLGQEIIIDACVLDYYGKIAEGAQFAVRKSSNIHHLNGTNFISVSCDALQGISVVGEKVVSITNFSLTLTSHAGSQSDLKTISVELITQLTPCHPGFYYDDNRCVCYRDDDIITCSGSTSLIRRGYWFGEVSNKSTMTVCPSNYCNFTCCEVSNGFYQLSPVRMNQCNSHRSGTACGNCEEGYTLSFDSVECVSVDKCTKGQTALVVTLSMIYWIVIVILVFIMTYYHVGIGYLYAITYYYSMLDIILNHSLYQSKGLIIAVYSISSAVKITPQFLGQFCLVDNISGIDQQFIHYTHPLAVSVLIAIICQTA